MVLGSAQVPKFGMLMPYLMRSSPPQ
jgi:hypothetical protein